MTAICQIRHVSGWEALCKSIDWQCVLIASQNLVRTRDGWGEDLWPRVYRLGLGFCARGREDPSFPFNILLLDMHSESGFIV